MPNARRGLLPIAPIAVLLAGCGGTTASSSKTAPTPTPTTATAKAPEPAPPALYASEVDSPYGAAPAPPKLHALCVKAKGKSQSTNKLKKYDFEADTIAPIARGPRIGDAPRAGQPRSALAFQRAIAGRRWEIQQCYRWARFARVDLAGFFERQSRSLGVGQGLAARVGHQAIERLRHVEHVETGRRRPTRSRP